MKHADSESAKIFAFRALFMHFMTILKFKMAEKQRNINLGAKIFTHSVSRGPIYLWHMKNRNSIFWIKTRFLPDYSLSRFRVFGQKNN